MTKTPFDSVKEAFKGYFSLNGYLVSQDEAEKSIRDGVSFKGTNILILVFAMLIASLGLNTNSTAVIIGAMLISPLMGPIIGLGLAVGVEDFTLLKRSLRNLTVAAGLSVLASTCYFLISPVSQGHSELLARTSPTIYDVLIGFFGGAAGIFAIASKNKGNVIPGVAIATALMPPLCTAGYGLATWQMKYFFGATYLFLINSIYIGLATFIGVKLMNFHKADVADSVRARRIKRIVYAVAILTMLPSVYLTYNMLRYERFQQNVSRFVTSEMKFPATQVLGHNATMEHGKESIAVTLIGKVLPSDSLKAELVSKLKFYGLSGASLYIFQGDSPRLPSGADLGQASTKELYDIAQATLSRKQIEVDSLRSVLAMQSRRDTIVGSIVPEIKVLFPQVEDIAVSRMVSGNVATGRLDTVEVAVVKYAMPMPTSRREELTRYLEVRLQVKGLQLVTSTGNP